MSPASRSCRSIPGTVRSIHVSLRFRLIPKSEGGSLLNENIPYGKHHVTDDDLEAVRRALTSDRITQGKTIERFEDALSDHFGCDHAVVVNNGTSALRLAYGALGVEPGQRVLTTPNTFVATVNGIVENRGVPELVDIDPTTFNLSAEQLEQTLESGKYEDIVGITAVHFAGLPCDMSRLEEIARRHGLFLLEDACHAPGAEWKPAGGDEWIRVGSCEHSSAAILSFHPVKHFTTGEGGAVLTNDASLADRVRNLRGHGIVRDPSRMHEHHGPWYYEMQSLGMNARLTDIQSALGLSQLQRLPEYLKQRRRQAQRYRDAFREMEPVTCQSSPGSVRHAYHLFVIRARRRDRLFEWLRRRDIYPQVHYIPVHFHPYYRQQYGYAEGDFPEAEAYYREALSLPLFPTLTRDQQQRVISSIREFYDTYPSPGE